MPRQWPVYRIVDGKSEQFTATYCDDVRERADAVRCFQTCGVLFPVGGVPAEISNLPRSDLQAHLDAHPTIETWEGLKILPKAAVSDSDLEHLRYLPELRYVRIYFTRTITDAGVRHLRWLECLEQMILYSACVTDASLEVIGSLSNLRQVDMQLSCGVTPDAFHVAMRRLPRLQSSWPPSVGSLPQELSRFMEE